MMRLPDLTGDIVHALVVPRHPGKHAKLIQTESVVRCITATYHAFCA
jgi:hypothetical protein